MKSEKWLWLTVMLAPLVASCSLERKGSEPISIKEGLALVERDLAETNPVVLSDVPNNPDAVGASILAAQCLYQVANPPVPVITGPISVALTGTFTQTPSAQIGWTATGPGAQLGFQVAKAEAQALTVPVTFIAATSLPNVYLQQQLAYLTGFDPKDSHKADFVNQAINVQKALTPIVENAIRNWPGDRGMCPKNVKDAISGPSIPQLQ
jgi:hypothetical protein